MNKLNVVLFEPQIPENAGNIARTCVAMNATLHLIKPYGFYLDNKNLIRSGVDYWDKLILKEHICYDEFIKSIKETNYEIYYFSRYGVKTPSDIAFNANKDIYIMFGKESTGIDKDILKLNEKNTIRIPSSKNVRSMNLSNCVAMVCYEYSRQNDFNGLELLEPHKPLF